MSFTDFKNVQIKELIWSQIRKAWVIVLTLNGACLAGRF